jgi:hypothetical protein
MTFLSLHLNIRICRCHFALQVTYCIPHDVPLRESRNWTSLRKRSTRETLLFIHCKGYEYNANVQSSNTALTSKRGEWLLHQGTCKFHPQIKSFLLPREGLLTSMFDIGLQYFTEAGPAGLTNLEKLVLKGENAALWSDADMALRSLLKRLTTLEFSAARGFRDSWGKSSLQSKTLRTADINVHQLRGVPGQLPPLNCPCLNTVRVPLYSHPTIVATSGGTLAIVMQDPSSLCEFSFAGVTVGCRMTCWWKTG